jgi:tetratricopeptide (TPR) repeat protein
MRVVLTSTARRVWNDGVSTWTGVANATERVRVTKQPRNKFIGQGPLFSYEAPRLVVRDLPVNRPVPAGSVREHHSPFQPQPSTYTITYNGRRVAAQIAMKVWTLTICFAAGLWGADERQLALALKAQMDFERVELSAKPTLAEAETCQQSQAAIITVALPEELPLLHFRKGYCALAGAVATTSKGQLQAAAAEFDLAKEAWPGRMRKAAKNTPAEPVSSGIRVLAAIARLQADAGETERANARQELADAAEHPSCTSNVMSAEFCRQLVETGRQWLGWMALRNNDLDAAARLLSFANGSGWNEWVQGRRKYEAGSYADAVAGYTQAIGIWKSIWQDPPLLRALGPRPSIPIAMADLGAAQLLAGDTAAAIRTLDASLKADASNAHALYLRARAKELAGQSEAALADYNLASRTAFASAQDLASGEAHLYRGIAMYRRKDFKGAEDEFATALNFEIAPALRADATAWRHLAAVAAGSCTSAREFLEGSLPKASPFFPKNEARAQASACNGTASR